MPKKKHGGTYRCPVCNKRKRDEPWAALYESGPGPKLLEIGRVRHGQTPLQSMAQGMRDDDGKVRCVTCLRVVPPDQVLSMSGDYATLKLFSFGIFSGDELMCCGGRASAGANPTVAA